VSSLKSLWTKLKVAAADATDPGREHRIGQFAAELRRALVTQRREFSVDAERDRLSMTSSECRQAAALAYRVFVQKSWEDERQTEKERQQLDWIAAKLELRPSERQSIDEECGRRIFLGAIAHVFADGDVTDVEVARLDQIAASLGTTTAALVQRLYEQEAIGLLRRQFADAAPALTKDPAAWRRIAATARRLGFSESATGGLLEQQMRAVLGHFFADAAADNRLDSVEREAIDRLLNTLPLPASVREYFQDEVRRIVILTDVAEGRMPTATIRSFSLDAGERGFFEGPALFQRVRTLRSGPRLEEHGGVVGITDTRLLFRGEERSFAVRLRKVIGVDQVRGGVDISSGGKADGTILFGRDAGVPTAILRKAVALAKQTETEAGRDRSRFVARDVRQRVWQKYGGSCANCAATQYLEFDHIVPVARGGSNSEQNVQLLCRACNIAKSDRI
jgi:uncharacterized membrane protein YebE (DUF533 family)